MGKRKRRDIHNKIPPPVEIMPYSSKMNSLSKEKSSRSGDTGAVKPLSSIMDSSVELPHAHLPLAHHHPNFSRSILLRRQRHYYGRQYSRRKSANNADTSTSHGKGTLCDEKFSFKLASQCNSDSERHTVSKEKAFCKPERIRSSSLTMNAVSPGMAKMVCGICQKLLRKKPYILGNTLSSSDLSVVAVLVCGHTYHADCLEQRTRHEDRRDPPCPLCVACSSAVDA